MKLEEGKFYRHKETDSYIAIVGKVDTTMWGDILVGESPEEPYGLIPIDGTKDSDEWEETTKEEWVKQFAEEEEEEEESETKSADND